MLASDEIIRVVADTVKNYNISCVVDPVCPLVIFSANVKVMISTSGSVLLPESAAITYVTNLLPVTTLLTPNFPEAIFLANLCESSIDWGNPTLNLQDRLKLATFLSKKSEWVLLKGGHAPLERNGKKVVVDILVNKCGTFSREYISEFSPSKNTHGTGCTLSCFSFATKADDAAAIAANIGLGYDMEIAVEKAIDYVQGAIMHSYPLGKGHGRLNHLYRQRNLPFTP